MSPRPKSEGIVFFAVLGAIPQAATVAARGKNESSRVRSSRKRSGCGQDGDLPPQYENR